MESFTNLKHREIAKITQRRRQILVHSYMLHELKSPIASEKKFHGWCEELLKLQAKYPIESQRLPYYKEFIHFSNAAEFTIPYHEYPWIEKVALFLLGEMEQ